MKMLNSCKLSEIFLELKLLMSIDLILDNWPLVVKLEDSSSGPNLPLLLLMDFSVMINPLPKEKLDINYKDKL